MEDWVAELRRGQTDAAWDLVLSRYRRVIFAAIRHYAQDYDDVMDVFARVCEALREDDLRRLRSWADQAEHRARFSTWLVTVVRHLTVDWFRHRDGRRRLSTLSDQLPPIQRRIYQLVFLEGRSHVEAFERIRSDTAELAFPAFQRELRATYRAVTAGRRGAVLRELGTAPPDAGDDAPVVSGMERPQLLEQALASLSELDRLVVQMSVVDEVPAATIASILGLPNAKAVYNRLHRALRAVRDHLTGSGVRGGDDL